MTLLRFGSILFWALGVASIAWAFLEPRFRDPEGSLEGSCCLPVAVGVALLILGWGVTKPWRQSAFWFALALAGQAVALQLIDAGPALHYQHYKPIGQLLTETHPALPLFIVLQSILVAAGLGKRWPSIRAWLGRTFKTWQIIAIGLVFVLTSATVSAKVSDYLIELVFATLIQAVNLGNIVLAVSAVPEEVLAELRPKMDMLLGPSELEDPEKLGRVDWFSLLAALTVTVLAAVLSILSYQRHPHIPDEVMYVYQARYLAAGQVTVPAPPVPEAFSFYLVPYRAEQWYSIFPPGWPAILALGVLAGVPWLVNPILAGANVLLAYVLLQEIYDRRVARIVVLLLCASPWFIFMGMNFMAHTFTLTGALFAALGIARAKRTGKARWALLAGFAVGVVSLIRPMDGVIVGGLLGLWALGIGGQRLKASGIAAFMIGAVVVGALVLPYNALVSGKPLAFPLMAYYEEYFGPKTNALGFGPERGLGWAIDPFPGHSPLDAVVNANLNAFSVNAELFGWSMGSLILILVLLFSMPSLRRDWIMIAVTATVVGAYGLYWFSGGPDFGARYWFLIIIPLVVLSVRGIQVLADKAESGSSPATNGSTRVMVGLLSVCILALISYFPWRAVDKYHHFRGMRPDVYTIAEEYNFGRSLVLIRGDAADYQSAWTYNPLDFDADVPLYAWDTSPEVRFQVVEAYRDRPVWIVSGPSITHRGFEVLEGPLAADQLLAEEQADRDVSP